MLVGLAEKEILSLQEKYGENILPSKEGTPPLIILLRQFKNPLIYVLLLIGFFSALFGEFFDVILILAVAFLNVSMSFFQEYNAQKTLMALRQILKPIVVVMRGGLRKRIEAKNLVPGDLVILGAGDKVPADGKLIEGNNLLLNEAILTGEEEAVNKSTKEKENDLFMGTIIIFGQGIMRVSVIGQETQVGKIGKSLAEIQEEPTPLQIKLGIFIRSLAKFILVVCSAIFLVGLILGQGFWQMLKTSIVLSLAAIPEGIPMAITVVLILGMRRVLKRNGLVKNLLSVETLGSTSVICTDKTGTLTEGKMKVVEADFVDQTHGLLALMLANNQRTNIEMAFWDHVFSQKHLIPKEIVNSMTKIYEEPFDSEKKYSLAINKIKDKETAFIVGGAEIVLSFCQVQEEEKNKILSSIKDWASRGLKVVGLAYKEKENLKETKNYSWLGLVGIEDPLREGVKEAIETAQQAGIKIKIVTGDYRLTAERIASNLGLKFTDEQVIEGSELETITDENLRERINEIVLFTRTTPHQKLKIVKALQDKGEVVAMTGDGVNDAPALKKADIGVVVGSGSDVAKEASDLILLDNNFKTIVIACEEGRLILSNLKKVIGYALSNSFAEIILIFGAMIVNLPTPLTVVQILWIHLICDGPPDILLSFEPKENGLMQENPRALRRENILSPTMKLLILVVSLSAGLASLFLFSFYLKSQEDLILARTIAFATLSIVDIVYIFAFKNSKKIIFQTENFFANKLLFLGLVYGFILIFAAIYLPVFNRLLGTMPLQIFEWLLILAVALMVTSLIELVKFVATRKAK